jgi:hypothetical protein
MVARGQGFLTEFRFDEGVDAGIVGLHIEPQLGADDKIRVRFCYPLDVAVIVRLIAAIPSYP